MKAIVLAAALLLGAYPLVAQNAGSKSASKTDTLVVKTSAKCGMCKRTLETQLIREPGVQTVSLDVKSKNLTLVYNPRSTSAAKLRTAVTKVGYDADDQVADQKAHDRLKPCCRKDAAEHED